MDGGKLASRRVAMREDFPSCECSMRDTIKVRSVVVVVVESGMRKDKEALV